MITEDEWWSLFDLEKLRQAGVFEKYRTYVDVDLLGLLDRQQQDVVD